MAVRREVMWRGREAEVRGDLLWKGGEMDFFIKKRLDWDTGESEKTWWLANEGPGGQPADALHFDCARAANHGFA